MNEMNITSAIYLSENTGIKIELDNQTLYVPLDPANRHYDEIMRQVEAGTLTIQEAE